MADFRRKNLVSAGEFSLSVHLLRLLVLKVGNVAFQGL